MQKIIFLSFVLVCFLAAIACDKPGAAVPAASSDTPTAAYKRLFAAVKGKNTDAIKAEMSRKTIEFAESAASRQNTPVAKVFENGFTASTFWETLPEIRDERVSGDMGAVEVYNSKEAEREDLPFVLQNGKGSLLSAICLPERSSRLGWDGCKRGSSRKCRGQWECDRHKSRYEQRRRWRIFKCRMRIR